MNETGVKDARNKHPFYSDKIAWLPIFLFKKGDEWNSRKIAVRWLVFLACDNMAPQFEISMGADFNLAHLRISIPYISFYIRIPLPRKWDQFSHRNLWRVGARSKYGWQK